METIELKLDGMHGDGCVRRVRGVLGHVPGVVVDDVQVGSAKLRIVDPLISKTDIEKAIEGTGFALLEYRSSD